MTRTLEEKEEQEESWSAFNLSEGAAEIHMSSGGIQTSFSPDKTITRNERLAGTKDEILLSKAHFSVETFVYQKRFYWTRSHLHP
jgi:hypothetical protein